MTYADRSSDAGIRMIMRTTHANALHQAGHRAEAEARFREAEALQAECQPAYPLLYSLRGFQYCDLLLVAAERAAWQTILDCGDLSPLSAGDLSPSNANQRVEAHEPLVRAPGGTTSRPGDKSGDKPPRSKALRAVAERAAQTLQWAEQISVDILSASLDRLTLGRAALYDEILEGTSLGPCHASLQNAVAGLRRAGQQDYIPLSLLTRAWLRFLDGTDTGAKGAQTDLDEAWEIAERGPMRLHIADIHLYRARLFHGVQPYPWTSPQEDLDAARKLIEQCGYWRRKEELEDAEAAAKNW